MKQPGHPWLARCLDVAMAPLAPARALVVPAARGRVVEVGCGTGLNFEHYRAGDVSELVAVDPDPFMLARARPRAAPLPFPVALHETGGDALPLDDASADTAVVSFVLCTIPDVPATLAELRRVLRPGGTLLFVEHTRSPRPAFAALQNALTPLWKRLFGGCHLNRDAVGLLRAAGFAIAEVAPIGNDRWTPLPVYRGVARADG
jgi:ubiquinone/menaquinone biosynthesis C-methylase UbiE